jgi:hypothetical protein
MTANTTVNNGKRLRLIADRNNGLLDKRDAVGDN